MTRHLFIACLIYVALVLQPSIATDPTFGIFRPWLPGIVLVISVLITEGMGSLIWAGLIGLGVDCLSIERLGVHIVIATAVASTLMRIRNEGKSHGVLMIGALVFAGTFLWRSMAAIVHGILDQQVFDVASVSHLAFTDAVSTATLVVGLLLAAGLFVSVFRSKRHQSVVLANRWIMLTGK